MKTSFRVSLKIFLIILLVVLFPTCIHSMQKNEKIPSEVILGGELLQVNMNTNKVMYYNVEENSEQLQNYDLLCKVDGKTIKNRDDIFKYVLKSKKSESIEVLVLRNNEYETLYLNKKDMNPSHFTEYIPFCATLTYINPKDNTFGAVAHNIKVPNLDNILSKKGEIYLCNMLEIKRSTKSELGSIHGKMKDNPQGKITRVNEFGAKGNINISGFKDKQIYEVSRAKDVKIGNASLVISNTGEDGKHFYDINITKVNKQYEASTQGFEFEITDKEFLKQYGGILQGMSGSPIIQNGKIIGALSHVISTNSSNGIGLYIEWMMEK